jgi:6-phosphogluconolactonase
MVTLHVGTYAKDGGRGLVPVTIGEDGALVAGEPFAGAPNASFAAQSQSLAYLVDERDEGAVTVVRRDERGWVGLARVPTQAKAPCHVALDRNGSRLAVANYGSGSVTLYALDGQGLPIEPPALFQGRGSGPNQERQEGPHAHCVRFSHGGEGLYLVDLGADRVECLTLGKGALFVEAKTAWQAPPGSGPRHLVFHPRRPLALVLSELASTLTLLELHDGALRERQTLSTLPAGYAGESLGGHLELSADGGRVYASNRGHDSIAVFAFDGDRLESVAHVPSGGAHPRHFLLLEDEGLIAVAHEKDGRVALLEIAEDTLRTKGAGVTVPGACFLLR